VFRRKGIPHEFHHLGVPTQEAKPAERYNPGLVLRLPVDRELLASLNQLVTKISLWWGLEVEVPANPDYDGVEVKEEDVLTGPYDVYARRNGGFR
jgi:hypothetical protein